MDDITLKVEPVSVPEWDAEDETAATLADDEITQASEDEMREMLNALTLRLPKTSLLEQVKLIQYAQQHQTPLELPISPDNAQFDYYLVKVPLTILVPNQRLTRLRLNLELRAAGYEADKVVAYDLFPNDRVDVQTIMSGNANLNVSKALKYVLTAAGAAAAAGPISEALDFKLELPFKWTSKFLSVQTSDQMSNPVEWYVQDASIQNGFTGYVIVRAPKDSQVVIAARLVGEVRRAGLLGRLPEQIVKSQFKTDTHEYPLKN